jgi:uncharacterized protein YbjQ (UPF0145 family)
MDFVPVQESSAVHIEFTSTTFDIAGHRTVKSFGVVQGIAVRSRNICMTICALLCSLGGGSNPFFVKLCEQTRQEAHVIMCQRARCKGANALVGIHFETNEIADGITEVCAYGTAVFVELGPNSTATQMECSYAANIPLLRT